MRIFPVLALVVFLVPSTLTAGRARFLLEPRVGMCREQMGFVERDIAAKDAAGLRGLLLPGGVSIASPDGSVNVVALRQAAEAWNRALGSAIVRVAADADEANVVVRKVDGIDSGGEEQGLIEVDKAADGSLSADVLIDSRYDGLPLSDVETGAVLTHELGHFLGLDDLAGPGRIMGEFDRSRLVVRPSVEEAEAVHALRLEIRRALWTLR